MLNANLTLAYSGQPLATHLVIPLAGITRLSLVRCEYFFGLPPHFFSYCSSFAT